MLALYTLFEREVIRKSTAWHTVLGALGLQFALAILVLKVPFVKDAFTWVAELFVVLIGHGNCGKTSLASALLFTSGAVNRLGSPDAGNATTDYSDDEHARKVQLRFNQLGLKVRDLKTRLPK